MQKLITRQLSITMNIQKNADKIAIQNFSNIIAKNPKNKILKSIQKRICKDGRRHWQLPNHWISKKVIDELNKINNSGVDGVVISFLNFKDEVKFFTQKVLSVINK